MAMHRAENWGALNQSRPNGWRLRLVDARFLLAGLFPAGVLLSAEAWGEYLGDAVLLSLITSLCFMLFLAGVREISDRTLMPILIALVFIIAYPLKIYVFAVTAWDPTGLGALSFVLTWAPILPSNTLYEVYEIGMLGLMAFFVTASFLIRLGRNPRQATAWRTTLDRRTATRLLWIALGISVVVLTGLNLLALKLGILRMGIEPRPLPFRLGGVIFFSRAFVGSFVLSLILFFGLRLRAKRIVGATIIAFVYAGLFTAIVSASRGSLLMSFLLPVWLAIVTGEMRMRHIVRTRNVFVGLILMTVLGLMHPLITSYRTAATEEKLSDTEALQAAVTFVGDRMMEDPLGVATAGVGSILARIVGAENLIIARETVGVPDREAIWRYVVHRGHLMAVYYTREVLGYNTYDFQITPGLVAFFWFLGGSQAVVGGMVLFTLFAFIMIGMCRARVIQVSGPVQVAIIAPWLAILVSEGTLQQALSIEQLLMLLGSIAATETLGRLFVFWSRFPHRLTESRNASAPIIS